MARADDEGNIKETYIYAGDDKIAIRDSDTGAIKFIVKDHLGSTRVIVNESGNMTATYLYDPWGADYAQCQIYTPFVSQGTDFKYTGQIYDDDDHFNLYYYGARYYDPALGIFRQVDPAMDAYPGWSPYAYTLNNPLKYVDPDGEAVETVIDVACVGWSAYDLYNEPSWKNAGLLGLDIIGAAVPFLPAVGAVRHGAKVAKLFNKADDAVDAVKTVEKVADAVDTGTDVIKAGEKHSYVHTFESGKEYIGKGTGPNRMQQSKNSLEKATSDKVVSTNAERAVPNTDRQAFIDEAKIIEARGGVKSDNLYNKIDSPGKKYLENQE